MDNNMQGDTSPVTGESEKELCTLNSSNMQRGMSPPQDLAVEVLSSKRNVLIPQAASASAAEESVEPHPMTATHSLRPQMGDVV
ncbi:conserved hypothetical protein [Ricinus communis]|uniref:Uncharacterized protein n=1 Tax=Ricinus communis TaxID=3988 RepID=B9RTM8_RICCO|nr:conserved hypothetical protein [Ricinus communis]